jgi:hypothetical protein
MFMKNIMRDGGLAAPELTQAARRLGLLKTQGDRDHVKLGKATAGLLGASRALVVELRDVSIEDIRQARPKTHQEPTAKIISAFGKDFAEEANRDWLASLPSMDGDAAGEPDLLDNMNDDTTEKSEFIEGMNDDVAGEPDLDGIEDSIPF